MREKQEQLILILGDQLDRSSAALAQASPATDTLLMIESRRESERIRSHKLRTSLFLSAMRHHAEWLRQQGFSVDYVHINQPQAASFHVALQTAIAKHHPCQLLMVHPGEYSVLKEISQVCQEKGLRLTLLEDSHFICKQDEFANWRKGRRVLVMEHFYRFMRKRHQILMQDKKPLGGKWNFDQQNRKGFGRAGPGLLPQFPCHTPDRITHGTLKDVNTYFPDNPGSTTNFNWPVTREQALELLNDFIAFRLPNFGPYQDAMWRGEAFLYHSGISAALNLKLLNPMEVIEAVIDAYQTGQIPIQSVEGFIRQILGWREYVHGIYWSEMPGYTERNALQADLTLPGFYWNGDTDMVCLQQVIQQTLRIGYAHHIQRLMVTGLFALLLGVRPQEVHAWYLGVYVDAVEWVEAPNTLGMSQYADGGVMASKPYVASGRYIQRMSNYCRECPYRPDKAIGEQACPFTTLYWDFLLRHKTRFTQHPRAGMQWRSLQRLDRSEQSKIKLQAARLKHTMCA